MAGEELYTALQGLNVAPAETPWGMGATTLAKSLPNLVNPYSSPGTNLATVLGGTLLSSLLGYQASRQATEQSLQLGRLGAELQGYQTPKERLSFIEGVDDNFMQRRLLGLQNALQARESAIALGAQEAQQKQEAQYAALGSPAGQAYIDAQTRLYSGKQDIALENKMALEAARKETQSDLIKLRGDEKTRIEGEIAQNRLRRQQEGVDPILNEKLTLEEVRAKAQDALKQAESRRRMAEDQFKSALDAETTDLPKEVRQEVSNATSISTRMFDLANRIENLDPLKFKIYKNWDSLPNSFKAEFADIKSVIGNARYGASLTGNELRTLESIFGSDFTTGPEAFARNLRNASTALLQKAKTGVQISQMKPVNVNSMIDQMIQNQAAIEDVGLPVAPKAELGVPVAADIEGVFGQLSEASANIAMPTPTAAPTTPADSADAIEQEQAALLQEAERYDQQNGVGSARQSPTFQQRAAQLKQRRAKLGI